MPDQIAAWAELAAQARALADLADRCAAVPAIELEPCDYADPLNDVHARTLELVKAAGACRAATWQALVDDGMTKAEIGRRWRVGRNAVTNATT